MMIDIIDLIRTQNEEYEEQIGTKYYVPEDQRTILMEHALVAVEEVERLRASIVKLSLVIANPHADILTIS